MHFWERRMAEFTDFLTRVRPVSTVRKIQILFVGTTLCLVTYILSIPFFGQSKVNLDPEGPFAEGKIAEDTIQSTKEFFYEDMIKTELEQAKASSSVPFNFDKDFSILTEGIAVYIEEDFDALKNLSTIDGKAQLVKDRIPRFRNRTTEELQSLLDYPKKDKLKGIVQQHTNSLFSRFCIIKEEVPFTKELNQTGAKIRNLGTQEPALVVDGSLVIYRGELYRSGPVSDFLSKVAEEKLKNVSPALVRAVSRISAYYLYSFPACAYNITETENARKKAAAQIPIQMSRIAPNEVIIRTGEVVTPAVRLKLSMLNRYATRANISSIMSIFLSQSIFVAIIGFYLINYRPKRLNDLSSNLIIFLTLWIVIAAVYIVSKGFYHSEFNLSGTYFFGVFVPIGMLCLLLGFIYDEQLSISLGFYLSFVIFFASRYNPTSFMLSFAVTVASGVYGRKLAKRIDFLKAGFLISFVQLLICTAGYLFDGRDFFIQSERSAWNNIFKSNYFQLIVVCFINGFGCSTAVQFLLPIYEYIFNIPTRFKLIELADTGHPLLQDLLTKAPSTYTHTFMVAALSERAAQNLKLNTLLVRVGVYFHDIGKIPNAGFFIENQHLIPKPENIDKNNPALAAKTVIDHVLDGIEMAKKARLPREIINFIPEHHGTSTMAFFYHKALQELPSNSKKLIHKKDFQYPGPIPQSKETGIVMIADSLEAASRSLDDVSPEALEDLIQKIINSKLAENQLDQSGLTLGDLQIIKASFKEVLLSSLHQRPKYPKPDETRALEKKHSSR